MSQCDRDVVETFAQTPARVVVDGERCFEAIIAFSDRYRAPIEIDCHARPRHLFDALPDGGDGVTVHLRREQTGLTRVAAEDVSEARGDDNAEAVVLQRPYGVLA